MSKANLDKAPPLVLFKVGVQGSTPYEFGARLAGDFEDEMQVLTVKAARAAIRAERSAKGLQAHRDPATNEIHRRLVRDGHGIVSQGHDLILDAYFRTRNTRFSGPLRLARTTGALSVALDIYTPEDAIRQRLSRWKKNTTTFSSKERAGFAFDTVAFNGIERPSPEEGISHIITLDGTLGAMAMVETVEDYLEAHGLLMPE